MALTDDIKVLRVANKENGKQIALIRDAVDAIFMRLDAYHKAIALLAKRSQSCLGSDPGDMILIAPHNKPLPLPADITPQAAPGIWRLAFAQLPSDEQLELLQLQAAAAAIRQQRLEAALKKAEKEAKEATKNKANKDKEEGDPKL